MEIKYNLVDTIGKTKKANTYLQISDNFRNKNYLYDFSLLEKYVDDPQVSEVIDDIKKQCLSDTSIISAIAFIYKSKSQFSYYSGNLYFKPYVVISDGKNKRVYTIMQLVKIERLTFMDRNFVYDEYNSITEINDVIGTNYMIEHIDID